MKKQTKQNAKYSHQTTTEDTVLVQGIFTKSTSKDSKVITMAAYIAKTAGHAAKTILREKITF